MSDVVIDVTRLLDRLMHKRLPTGVDRVSLAYVLHYRERAKAIIRLADYSFVLSKRDSFILFDWLLRPKSNFEAIKIVVRGVITGWRGRSVSGRILFNTGHSALEKMSYPAMLKEQGVQPVFMVHDLIPVSHPEYCRFGERDKHRLRMRNVLNMAKGVICNSRATLNHLKEFASENKLHMPPSVVALLAPGVAGNDKFVRLIPEPYFVIISTIEGRKNHLLLLQIWRQLAAQLGDKTPKLVIIGQRGWECENVIDMLDRCEAIRPYVIELSQCSDDNLVSYLQHAQALLFPSFSEGYGMPLVEALALGVPVIASDLSVFREIAGEIPEYLDPIDGLGWIAMINAYSSSENVKRVQQIERLNTFKIPTWANHFNIVDNLLMQIAGM